MLSSGDEGVEVVERQLTYEELLEADELFSTGNYSKVTPCTKLDDRILPKGPMFERTRGLYLDFAKAC